MMSLIYVITKDNGIDLRPILLYSLSFHSSAYFALVDLS